MKFLTFERTSGGDVRGLVLERAEGGFDAVQDVAEGGEVRLVASALLGENRDVAYVRDPATGELDPGDALSLCEVAERLYPHLAA